MTPTDTERELINAYFSMRSRGIALIKEAEKGLEKKKIVFVPCFSERFINRQKQGEL
ncbi:hypothetical protein LCGC14_1450190 [marine sediment metagenome]|uniref:Uncharacterized protein n=1 Tax=marine sediment metagenome TaxID=412755 RepID=A0A0F9LYP8_9ZZZZ